MRIERFSTSVGIEELNKSVSDLSGADFVHIRHHFDDCPNLNLISISRSKPEYRETLRHLTDQGYHLYKRDGATSSFVSFPRIKGLWTEVDSGKILFDENEIAHTFLNAQVRQKANLLVVFSSIATHAHQSSLKRHFEHNYSNIEKYVPSNTHILRIADLGGVNGGWYTDTNFLERNFVNIQSLIKRTCSALDIASENAVLLGVSKGATAALLHGMLLNSHVVSVDPIVSDHLYSDVHDDLHFTVGNFPYTKDEIFASFSSSQLPLRPGRISIVYSDRSPQYRYINHALVPWTKEAISYVNVSNPEIKDHPDVGPKSISTTIMLVNMKLHRLLSPPTHMDMPFGASGS